MISGLMKHYHGAAIQTFSHSSFGDYACQGPYIKTWMEGAASWHPSIVGHRVRAAHHAYVWLSIFRDAIQEILWSKRALDAFLKDIRHHIFHNYKPLDPKPHFSTPFIDNTTCYTDYEPRSVRSVSLKKLVLSGLAPSHLGTNLTFHKANAIRLGDDPHYKKDNPSNHGWKFIIYENLVEPHLVENSLKRKYLDFKYLLFADETAGELSLKLMVPREGPVGRILLSFHLHL